MTCVCAHECLDLRSKGPEWPVAFQGRMSRAARFWLCSSLRSSLSCSDLCTKTNPHFIHHQLHTRRTTAFITLHPFLKRHNVSSRCSCTPRTDLIWSHSFPELLRPIFPSCRRKDRRKVSQQDGPTDHHTSWMTGVAWLHLQTLTQ